MVASIHLIDVRILISNCSNFLILYPILIRFESLPHQGDCKTRKDTKQCASKHGINTEPFNGSNNQQRINKQQNHHLRTNSSLIGYFWTCWTIVKLMLLWSFAYFSQNYFFQKLNSGTQLECQRIWIQVRTDVLSDLIWVQTVCKGYQQMTKVATRRKGFLWIFYVFVLSCVCCVFVRVCIYVLCGHLLGKG